MVWAERGMFRATLRTEAQKKKKHLERTWEHQEGPGDRRGQGGGITLSGRTGARQEALESIT